ncbi:MAG: BolA/IbaG family iron-sulfur metabolism protein [Gammaproteobacteria bacterium]|nr:BolA/IbaG family iron-sulfur metabolism protein [Gammaproteobacteria bacterium]
MIDDLKSRLEEAFPDAEVAVAGEGNRFEVHIVSAAFEGLSRVARQRAVYAVIGDLIASGAIHAVTIRASTFDENP